MLRSHFERIYHLVRHCTPAVGVHSSSSSWVGYSYSSSGTGSDVNALRALLNNDDERRRLATIGRQRIGGPGALQAILEALDL